MLRADPWKLLHVVMGSALGWSRARLHNQAALEKGGFKLPISPPTWHRQGNASGAFRRREDTRCPAGQLRPGEKAGYCAHPHRAYCPRRVGQHMVPLAGNGLAWLCSRLRAHSVREGLGPRTEACLRWDGVSLSRPGWGLGLTLVDIAQSPRRGLPLASQQCFGPEATRAGADKMPQQVFSSGADGGGDSG